MLLPQDSSRFHSVEGGELFDYIVDRGGYAESNAAYIIKQLVSAAQYMHQSGVAHRDLKAFSFYFLFLKP